MPEVQVALLEPPKDEGEVVGEKESEGKALRPERPPEAVIPPLGGGSCSGENGHPCGGWLVRTRMDGGQGPEADG